MRGQQDRGVVLIAVLLAVAIMSVMVVAVTSLARSGIASARAEARVLATRFALQSGVESGKALILATPPEQRVYFDGTLEMLDLGEGLRLEITIRDVAGFVDLNRSDLQLLEAVLTNSLGKPAVQDLGVRIEQWRKEAEAQAQQGRPVQAAEPAPANPDARKKKQLATDAPLVFVSVDQLLAIADPEDARDLARVLTVFNPTGLVNPLAAPDELLSSVPGILPGDLAIFKRAKSTRAWQSDQGLRQVLDRLKSFLAIENASVFTISVRLQAGPGIIPQSTAQAVVLLTEKGRLPFRTLSVTGL